MTIPHEFANDPAYAVNEYVSNAMMAIRKSAKKAQIFYAIPNDFHTYIKSYEHLCEAYKAFEDVDECVANASEYFFFLMSIGKVMDDLRSNYPQDSKFVEDKLSILGIMLDNGVEFTQKTRGQIAYELLSKKVSSM